MNKNIILIGMCGAGKSTIGLLLAKALARYFLDTDVYIQVLEKKSLQEIIDAKGIEEFCRIEQSHVLCIDLSNAVIATGGSVVYSEAAMQHLAQNGVIVHLDLPFEEVRERITNIHSRGIVKAKDQTLEDLYKERMPLYRRWAQHTIDCSGKNHDQVVSELLAEL